MTYPFRQRFLLALTMMTVAAGLVWWGTHTVTRLCGLAALLVATLWFALSLCDLRRHRRHSQTYLRHFAVAYAPYFVVAFVIAAILRAWIIFAPPKLSPLLGSGGATLQAQIAADTDHLLAMADDGKKDLVLCHTMAQTYQTFFQIDAVAYPKLHADAFLLSFAALLLESSLQESTTDADAHSRRIAIRLAASAAYLPLVRENSPDNRLLPLIEREIGRQPLHRVPRFPLHALRRHALP